MDHTHTQNKRTNKKLPHNNKETTILFVFCLAARLLYLSSNVMFTKQSRQIDMFLFLHVWVTEKKEVG